MPETKEQRASRIAAEDALPFDQLSPEQVARRKAREKKRDQRADLKLEQQAIATGTEKEWWDGNRARLNSEELAAMAERDAYLRYVMHGMRTVVGMPDSDPELIDIVVQLVKDNGVVHLGYIVKDRDIPSDWSSQAYWRDSKLMEKLTDENWQTAQFVKYGYLAALPDWRMEEFLTTKAGWTYWETAKLIGYVEQRDGMRYISGPAAGEKV